MEVLIKQAYIQIHPKDNVLVALQDLEAGQTISFNEKEYTLKDNIPAKYKLTLHSLNSGDQVFMYSVLIWKTTCYLTGGSHITTKKFKICCH